MKALELLDHALAIDPEYPLALSLAGWCYAQRSVYNWTDDIDSARSTALRLAEKAAEQGGEDPLILAVLGAVHSISRNTDCARDAGTCGRLSTPTRHGHGAASAGSKTIVNVPTGNHHFERALRLSPLDPMNFNNYVGMGSANEVAERYDESR